MKRRSCSPASATMDTLAMEPPTEKTEHRFQKEKKSWQSRERKNMILVDAGTLLLFSYLSSKKYSFQLSWVLQRVKCQSLHQGYPCHLYLPLPLSPFQIPTLGNTQNVRFLCSLITLALDILKQNCMRNLYTLSSLTLSCLKMSCSNSPFIYTHR